jgi:hypothetical protein
MIPVLYDNLLETRKALPKRTNNGLLAENEE